MTLKGIGGPYFCDVKSFD